MRYQLWCGKFNEEAYERDKGCYGFGLGPDSPLDILTDAFEFCGIYWVYVSDAARKYFDNITWMDWGSFVCRGDYDTMKNFLSNSSGPDTVSRFEALPRGGDYGFVYVEDP